MKHLTFLLAVAFLATNLLISCSSDDENPPDPGTPPEIPDLATVEMNFDDFAQSGRVATSAHWVNAALKVGVWNIVIGVTLALPVGVFKASIDQTPQYDFDRELWVWSFTYPVAGISYEAELTANVGNAAVDWEMRVSQEDGFQDVLWYSGTSQLDGSSGFWVLNKNAESPEEWLRIDWVREAEEIGQITYEDVSGGENDGGFIQYGRLETDGIYDTYYDISNAVNGNFVEIDWNRDTKVGQIIDPLVYGDESPRCWDGDFQDVDCSE